MANDLSDNRYAPRRGPVGASRARRKPVSFGRSLARRLKKEESAHRELAASARCGESRALHAPGSVF